MCSTGCATTSTRELRQTESGLARWAVVDGILVHYLDTQARFNTGERTSSGPAPRTSPPLLFIHGWLGCSYDFRDVLERLPTDVRGIAPDLPGSGLSQKQGIRWSMPFFTAFIDQFMDTLGLKKVVLVGHSFGANIAIRFAALHPRRVARIVLIDPDGLEGEEGFLGVLRRSRLLVEIFSALNNRLAIRLGLGTEVFYDPSIITREMVDAMVPTALSPEGRRAQAAITAEVLGRYPVDSLLPSIRKQVLLLWGANDRLLSPTWAERYLALLPDSRLVLIPRCGHMPQVERPGETTRLIVTFAGSPPEESGDGSPGALR